MRRVMVAPSQLANRLSSTDPVMSMTISRPLLRAQWLKSLSEVTAIGVISPIFVGPVPDRRDRWRRSAR